MKQKNVILVGIKKQTRFLATAVVAISLFAGSAFAATNGCEDTDTNEFINPAIALCSAHAYNSGNVSNPETPGDRQTMNDVVALKSTIIAQQMKKQYDYLETTIKRFKTQLEKAVLVSKIEAAGGGTGAADGGYGASGGLSGDRNIILAGTENCNNKRTTTEVFGCLYNNYNLIYNISNGGQNMNTDARRQLAADYAIMSNNIVLINSGGKALERPKVYNKNNEMQNGDTVCRNQQSISNRDIFTACMEALNAGIRSANSAIESASRDARQER